MKMIAGTGTISDYDSNTRGCTLKQWPYKIPVNLLADVQLYIDIGISAPGSIQYELIHTCGTNGGSIDSIIPTEYIVGQDMNMRYYGVFRNFTGSAPVCFVIAITIDSQIYFSEEYCIESACESLTLIKGCYGNLNPLISYDREGIYFGQSQGVILGSSSVVYEHKALMRLVEITLNAIKNTFKQGRTRTFRIEADDIFLFWAELIPEWYIKHIDAIFKRGEVYVGETKYLLEATAYEKTDECFKTWKPSVTLKESYFQSFSCELTPCIIEVAPEPCCDPTDVTAGVTRVSTRCCEVEIISADIENISGAGSEWMDLTFTTNTNLSQTLNVWSPTVAGNWAQFGLDILTLTADGAYRFQYVASDGDACIIGFNASNVSEDFTNYEYGAYLANGGDIYAIVNGTPSAIGYNLPVGDFINLSRTGSTFKIQTSINGETWTDRYTFIAISSATFYLNLNIYKDGSTTGKCYYPQFKILP